MRNTIYLFALSLLLLLLPYLAMAETATAFAKPLFAVSYERAEEAVSRALEEKGAGLKIGAKINGSNSDALFNYSKPLTVELRGLQFDKPSGHWSGNLLAMSGEEVVTAVPAAGRFDELAEIPMLKRTVKNGEVIAAKDIEIRDIPIGQTRSDTVTDMESLIGKSPSRTISAFRPIRDHEIGQPPLVKKNSIVQMNYASPGMHISTTGQAMEDGAKGSIIGVRNLASKKIVQAVVDDVATVTVSQGGMSARPEENGDRYAAN